MWNLCSGNTWANPSALLDGLGDSLRLVMLDVTQAGGVENVGTQSDLLGGLLRDGQCVAGDHLDRDAHVARGGDGRLGVIAWRVEQGQDTEELPVVVAVGAGDAQ